MPVVDIALGFIPESEVQAHVGTQLPLITAEYSNVYVAGREIWSTRVDAELSRPAAKRSNLGVRVAHLLKQKRAAIALDGLNGYKHRIPGTVEHRLIVGVQFRRDATAEFEVPVEILLGDAVIHLSTKTNAEPPRVSVSDNRRVVLQFEGVLRIERVAALRAAADERAQHLQFGVWAVGSRLHGRAEILE